MLSQHLKDSVTNLFIQAEISKLLLPRHTIEYYPEPLSFASNDYNPFPYDQL
jgi:hypothetical protein